MEPDAFVQGKWFDKRTMVIRVLAADVSTCTSKGQGAMEVDIIYDYVVESGSN